MQLSMASASWRDSAGVILFAARAGNPSVIVRILLVFRILYKMYVDGISLASVPSEEWVKDVPSGKMGPHVGIMVELFVGCFHGQYMEPPLTPSF